MTEGALTSVSAGEENRGAAATSRWRRVDLSRMAQAVVLVLPALVVADRGWDRRWITDDGFINMRIARMVLDGHGPVFNAGERVEAATSTLWLWALVVGDVVLPLQLEWVAVVLGLAGAVAGVLLATFGAARLHRGRGATGLLLPLGAAVVAAIPPFWEFSTSGLEGGLTFGWLGLTCWLLCRWATSGDRFGGVAAVVVGAAPLVRPDLGLALPLVLGGVLAAQWSHDSARDRVRLLAQALALPVAYQVFRMGYYGAVVPNTALAKSSGRGAWGNGVDYARDFAQPYALVVPLAALCLAFVVPCGVRAWRAADRRGLVALGALPLLGAADALYVVRVGGDYMHGRLLLPALFALVAPVAAVPVTRVAGIWRGPVVGAAPSDASGDDVGSGEPPAHDRPERGDRAAVPESARRDPAGAGGRATFPVAVGAAAVVVVAWAALAGTSLRRGTEPVVEDLFVSEAHDSHLSAHGRYAVTAEDQGWGAEQARGILESDVGVHVPAPIPGAVPRDGGGRRVYASYGIGVVGYVLGEEVYVLDMLGLADPLISRYELERAGPTGHEKPIPAAWLAARVSDGPVPPESIPDPVFSRPLHESPPGQLDADADAARRALGCGDLDELGHAVHDRLTPGRFLRNVFGSPARTRLTVPPDPQEAEQQFCG